MKSVITKLALFLSPFLIISCAGLKQRVDYTQFGEADPGVESRVVDTFVDAVRSKGRASKTIQVLSSTFPDGAVKRGAEVTMDPKKGTVVGKFKFKFYPWERQSTKSTAIQWTKKITQAAGGNTASVSFVKDYEDTKKLHEASGYIFKVSDAHRRKSL